MSEFKQNRTKFENHTVINVDDNGSNRNRRISIGTLEWLNGKVESLRRKFSAAAHEQAELEKFQKSNQQQQRKLSASDGDLIEMCEKYQISCGNKYTWVSEPFESIVTEYGQLVRTGQIEIHKDPISCPRGVLLMPLSISAGQTLLDFSEMGGFSLGRGSRVAKNASRSLSRTHCMIYLENNEVNLKDCDSKTGTFINGKLLGSSIPTLLENFDIIQMGYGGNEDDFIQVMVVFLAGWNAKEFAASSVNQQFTLKSNYSRTFSNSVATLMMDHPETEKPLVSSPRLTQISGPVSSKRNEQKETMVFEMPQSAKSPVKEVNNVKSPFTEIRSEEQIPPPLPKDPPPRRNQRVEEQIIPPSIQSNFSERQQQVQNKDEDQYKVYYHRSPVQTPKQQTNVALETPRERNNSNQSQQQSTRTIQVQSQTLMELSPRPPPVPKPRQMKKGLSKSAECLIEMDIAELALEDKVESQIKTANNSKTETPTKTTSKTETPTKMKSKTEAHTTTSNANKSAKAATVTVKMPLETALAARKSSITTQQQPVLNIAIPEFLRAENLKIPTTSPAQDLLLRAKTTSSHKPSAIPVSEKRVSRIEKMREKSQFTTVVQGANTKRFEFVLDFGSATCDISDGLALAQLGKKNSFQVAFNNFRINWILESLNVSSGCRLSVGGERNRYDLMTEGKNENSKIKIASVEINLKKLTTKIQFQIDDSVYKGITGTEIDASQSLPLKALNQLTYFYPHLELPTITLQGAPESPENKVTVHLTTSKKSVQVGKLIFEAQKLNWSRRQMVFAVDLDSKELEIDSMLCDAIQTVAVLHCLRYHID